MNIDHDPAALQARISELAAALQAAEAARQKAEEQLQEAEAKYRTLVEQIPAITYIVDVRGPLGTTIYISPRVKDILGYTQDEWLADPDLWIKLLHPGDHDWVLAEVNRQNATGAHLHLMYRSLTRTGKIVWFQNQSSIMLDEHGQPRYTHGIMLDITKLKEAEAELQQYKAHLEEQVTARTTELSRANQELTTLNRITQTITSTYYDLFTLLKAIAQELVALFNARNSGVTLLDDARTHLTVVADYSSNPQEVSTEGIVLPLENNLSSQHVVNTGHSIIVPDAQTSPLTTAIHDLMRLRRTQNLMIAPLLARGEVIGTIGIDTDDAQHAFTTSELTLLETIAGQIAGVIENTRLFETERAARQQAERLYAAATTLSSTLHPQQVGERILAELKQVVPYDSASIQVLTPAGRLRFIGGVGLPDLTSILQVEFDPYAARIPNAEVLRTQTPFIVSDVSQYPDFSQGILGQAQAQSWLGVPLLFGERLIGMLTLDKQQTNFYTPAQAQVALAFAAQAAIALENARLFAEAQRAREVAEAANQAKSLFLSNVSHELRTPLTAILGFTRIIQKRLEEVVLPACTPSDPKWPRAVQQVRENLGIILAEGERLTGMVNDVLDLAKIEAGKVEWKRHPVLLTEVVAHAALATRPLFEQKGLQFINELPPVETVPLVVGDEARLVQVVVNLFSNAVKFTERGSVTCQLRLQADHVQLRVTDTGIGIAAHNLLRVVEEFVQVGDALTDKPHGTGLGLAICRHIVEQHGGRFWAESQGLGHGSTFIFTLPIAKQETQPHVPA